MEDGVQDYWERRFEGGVRLASVGFLGLGETYNAWMYRVRRAVFLRMVRRHVPKNACVLDVGSGTGFYLERWREFGASSITASDFTEAVTSSLAQRYHLAVLKFDVGDPSVANAGHFDAISAMDVVFHIVDDDRYKRAFRNMASLLKPGGILIFTDNFLHRKALRSSHQVSRSLQETTTALREAGFATLARRPAFVLMNAPVDSDSIVLRTHWRLIQRIVSLGAFASQVIGALLYVPELILTSILREGPSTEVVVCRLNPPERERNSRPPRLEPATKYE